MNNNTDNNIHDPYNIELIEAQKIFFARHEYDRTMLRKYIKKCRKTNYIFEEYKLGDRIKIIIPALIDFSVITYEALVGDFKFIKRNVDVTFIHYSDITYKSVTVIKDNGRQRYIVDVLYKCKCDKDCGFINKYKIKPKYIDIKCTHCNRIGRVMMSDIEK